MFPGQLPVGELDPTVVDERGFDLEGAVLMPVEVGHTDTDATTMCTYRKLVCSWRATWSTTACICT